MEKNIFERAFELAPGCDTVDQLRAALKREGYVNVEQHFEGRQIKAQIAGMLRGSKA